MRWRTVIILALMGLIAKILLSATIDSTVGTWVGGALGFAAFGCLVVMAVMRSRTSRQSG